jgi:hypothetical protein
MMPGVNPRYENSLMGGKYMKRLHSGMSIFRNILDYKFRVSVQHW